MATFAGYGFNKSHSAAYALIAYQTAYLKANWPVAYMAALLTSEMNNTDKLSRYIEECSNMGFEVLPPEINQSEASFTVVAGNIRFGLAAIKNVGTAAVRSIVEERLSNGAFQSYEDFLERIDSRAVNKKVIESLIKCGAVDNFGYQRRPMVAGLEEALRYTNKRRELLRSTQTSFLEVLDSSIDQPLINLPKIEEWPKAELLNFEKELLGFYVTGHPLSEYEEIIRCYNSASSKQLIGLRLNTRVRIGGVITSIKRTVTKRGSKEMAIFSMEDLNGSIEVVVYPETYQEYEQNIEQNRTVMVTGQAQAQEDKPRIIAAEVVPLEEAPQKYAEAVLVNISSNSDSSKILEELNDIFRKYPGRCILNMCMGLPSGEKVTMAINTELKVNPNKDFVRRTEKLLGKGSVLIRKR